MVQGQSPPVSVSGSIRRRGNRVRRHELYSGPVLTYTINAGIMHCRAALTRTLEGVYSCSICLVVLQGGCFVFVWINMGMKCPLWPVLCR